MSTLRAIDPGLPLMMKRFRQTFQYYRATVCSCNKNNDGSFNPTCGCVQGYWYKTAATTTYGIRQKVSIQILTTPNGIIYNGGAQITIPQFYLNNENVAHKTLGRGDIFVIENKYKRESDVLKRGTKDFLFAFDVVEVLGITKRNADNTDIVAYVQDEDFTITVSQNMPVALTTINWVKDKGPADGEYYVVDYRAKEQFKVWDDGANDRGTDEDALPRKVLCVRRRYAETQTNNVDTIDLQEKIY